MFTRISDTELSKVGVTGLSDTPGLSTEEMQRKFDEPAKELLAPKHNTLVDELEAVTAAGNIGDTAPDGLTVEVETVAGVESALYAQTKNHMEDKENPHEVTASQTGAYTKAETDTAINEKIKEVGAGDMAKAVYDTNDNGIVDDAEKLNGEPAESYMTKAQYDTDNDGVVDNAAALGGHAPAYYGTAADVADIQAQIAGGLGVQMDLLWENAVPNGHFAEQTISLDLTAYDAILIAQHHTDTTRPGEYSQVAFKGYETYFFAGYNVNVYRFATPSNTGVFFSAAKYWEGEKQVLTNGAECVPLRIYGIKGVKANV